MNKSNIIEINKIGSRVKLTDDVYATITSCCVRGSIDSPNITYECGWWNGNSYDSRWFSTHEITVVNEKEKTKIGFV